MIREGIAFGELFNYLRLYSAQQQDIQFNSEFLYISRTQPEVERFNRSIELLQQRQIPLKCIFEQIISQQKLISSLKLTPEKHKSIHRMAEPFEPILKDIQIISTGKKSFRSSNLGQVKRKITQEDTLETPKVMKLIDFKIIDDSQERIQHPIASKKIGCSWKQKSFNHINETSSGGWWDRCTDLCSGDNQSYQINQYQVQAPQKQLRKIIARKHVPQSSINENR